MLTKDDLSILKQPFAASEHEFLKGNAYITEAAITERIEQIDPAWTLEQVSMFNRADSNQVVCTMRLTIKGVWRDGVGMSQITKLKSGDGEANEAEKSAATDAMKRAARLFGIGRYLLSLPDGVRDPVSMKDYLEGKKSNPYGGKPATTPPPAQNAPKANLNANNGTSEPAWDAQAWLAVIAICAEKGVTVKDALGVDRGSQWTKGYNAAIAAVDAYVGVDFDAMPKASGQ